MGAIAANVPVAYPHDGEARDKGSGVVLADRYRHPQLGMEGLRMLQEHATWPDGGYSTEAAVLNLQERIATCRFRVASTCNEFFEEYRQYHRDKLGRLVSANDDVLSAVFKTTMMLRAAMPGDGDAP